jgi:diaminopimelate decarboxylase
MSDNLRPMLYGARYEAHIASRMQDGAWLEHDGDSGAEAVVGAAPAAGQPGGLTRCVLAGKHCESGDVIARDVLLDDPRAGDIVVTPATGAYGFAMASNYNGVPRPPVIFCKDGDARVVIRRESYDDLSCRDVR